MDARLISATKSSVIVKALLRRQIRDIWMYEFPAAVAIGVHALDPITRSVYHSFELALILDPVSAAAAHHILHSTCVKLSCPPVTRPDRVCERVVGAAPVSRPMSYYGSLQR